MIPSHTVLPRGPHSTLILFSGLVGDSPYHDVAIPIEVPECRGQDRPPRFPLSLRPLIIRPRHVTSSARTGSGLGHEIPGPTASIVTISLKLIKNSVDIIVGYLPQYEYFFVIPGRINWKIWNYWDLGVTLISKKMLV